MTTKRKRGRPRKKNGERAKDFPMVAARVAPAIMRKLQRTARANGRSVSSEVALMIAHSLEAP